ncbi:spermidine/putrescine ABC transporter permease [Streptomyces sulfonofaciens]|uniref:Spermidine/putrescine ABC transporter permease n=1 Tax=Streptomyces sulfonofaciens TaxID=68272 RepID=A0A919GCG3_9ACTN|nr:ABC transporter permease subunit [Streptomyces sulfonofaciens]GHH81934.1 spermidine/putrescine ABC transporter permease [Streptomyces sulfonofaciens]
MATTTTPTGRRAAVRGDGTGRRPRTTATGVLTYAAAGCFVLVLLGLLVSVLVQSFATSWHGGWWPDGLTGSWFSQAWADPAYGVRSHLATTFEIGISVVVVSLLAGVPAAYALSRRSFPGKSLVLILLLLPIMLPPLTYATQLSSLIYTVGLGGTLTGVILSNLVPALPFVVLVMMPFVEQVRPDVEQAARVLGAGTLQIFLRVVGPLLLPGVLAASILTLVRVFGAFELTFFVSGPGSESLIVALFGAASNPAGSAPPLVAAMAVCYMGTSLVVFALALAFVNPTQIVSRR